MKELAIEIEGLNQRQQREIVNRLKRLSVELIAKLIDEADESKIKSVDEKGDSVSEKRLVIRKSQLNKLMAELNRIEKDYSDELITALVGAMTTSAMLTADSLTSVKGMTDKALIDVEKRMVKQVVTGDKTLEQRLQILSSDISMEMRKVIRQGVLGGDDVSNIVKKVRKTFDSTTWQIQRVVESEVYTAYRLQFAETASANAFDWIKLNEAYPRSKRRREHECYRLAHEDRYGKGQGVFKTSDNEIYLPHPQCTSWLELVEVRHAE